MAERGKINTLTQKYMTVHFPGLLKFTRYNIMW